ncbi:uncharacterized protein IWZ02DRAFT_449427 [Phyllosticta citriasiana]|uniref:SWR1-complex protein 3 domain-containing protein n=1 Tax=Phyllosticta citriasiana TaxID=595635 RepID=A0ABR1KQ81_9PEZI
MQPEPRRKSARNQKPDPPPEPSPPKQPPAKEKRKHTPAKEKTVQSAKSATPAPPPLPTKIGPGQPIPELKEPQPVDLPDSEWQTVTESGVLKAALERSRQKWMTPGIFELYYSKAGKKRLPGHKEREKEKEKDKDKGENGVEEKDSVKAKQMKREGNCKLYIDPHQWDVTIWTMREHTAPPPLKPKPPAHQPVTYGNHGQYHGGYAASHPYNYQSHNTAPKHPPPPPKQTPSKPPQPPPPARPTPTRPPATETSTPAPKPAPDPVIHMLAERANTNYKLRDVMKIVARGGATKEQLEYFQGHIDELNELLDAQKEAQAQKAQPPPPPARPPVPAHIASATPPGTPGRQTSIPSRPGNAPAQGTPSMPSTATPTPAKPTPSASAPPNMPQQPPMTYYTPPPQPSPFGHYPPPQTTSAAKATSQSPAPPPPSHQQQQQHQPQPQQRPPPQPQLQHPQQQQHRPPPQPQPQLQPPQAVQPPPPPQPTYRALCIDFNTNGDRLLFPRETILEALPGNQVLASFLKVQKIDLAAMNTLARSNMYYQALKEYYQPVTVRFRAADGNPGVLACLWRWVKPADEVRKHMDDVMDRCLPADVVEIAARLPREGTRAALGERDTSVGTPRESVELVGTPVEGREKKRVKRR